MDIILHHNQLEAQEEVVLLAGQDLEVLEETLALLLWLIQGQEAEELVHFPQAMDLLEEEDQEHTLRSILPHPQVLILIL